MKGKFIYDNKTIRYKLKLQKYEAVRGWVLTAKTRIGINIISKDITITYYSWYSGKFKSEEDFFRYINNLTEEELLNMVESKIKTEIDWINIKKEKENMKIRTIKKVEGK